MKKIIFRKFLTDCSIFFLISIVSTSLIIWVFQAVNYLDIIIDDGRGYDVYLQYTLLNLPKIISRILPFAFFFTFFYMIAKYENNNQLLIFWNFGVNKIKFVNYLLLFSFILLIIQITITSLIVPKTQKRKVKTDIPGGIPKIDDSPWPGFPADLTSIITVTATQCEGAVLIFEKMFESRLFWVDKLISMGAQIILCDPHRVVVSGPSPLRGALGSSPDIRAGMALLIAALGAHGPTEIMNIQQIDRGYESIDQRLNALGGKIKRVPV